MIDDVVADARYKPGWQVTLRTMHDKPHLWIHASVPDSNPPHEMIEIDHILAVPAWMERYTNIEAEREFVRESLARVEAHELGENLWFGDERPYLPAHGDEGDPYEQILP